MGAATRVQKEKENMKMEADHYQDKYEKAQVSFSLVSWTVSEFLHTSYALLRALLLYVERKIHTMS